MRATSHTYEVIMVPIITNGTMNRIRQRSADLVISPSFSLRQLHSTDDGTWQCEVHHCDPMASSTCQFATAGVCHCDGTKEQSVCHCGHRTSGNQCRCRCW